VAHVVDPSLDPDSYARALAFAARAHGDQRVPGNGFPYVVHLAMVAHEVTLAVLASAGQDSAEALDPAVAVPVALLHDVLEDTAVTAIELGAAFGPRILAGVQALTKDAALPKERRLTDSLERLSRCEPSVQVVKLADRTVNLLPPPPHWSAEKIRGYRVEASEILRVLRSASAHQAARLAARIERYPEPHW
jgi:(p)ppGpp synthase/HD superfamily hydrolase